AAIAAWREVARLAELRGDHRTAARAWAKLGDLLADEADAEDADDAAGAETEWSPEHRAKPEAPDQRSEGSVESDVQGGRMKSGLLAGTGEAEAARRGLARL